MLPVTILQPPAPIQSEHYTANCSGGSLNLQLVHHVGQPVSSSVLVITETPPDIASPQKLLSHNFLTLPITPGTGDRKPLMCGPCTKCVKKNLDMGSTYPIQNASADVPLRHCCQRLLLLFSLLAIAVKIWCSQNVSLAETKVYPFKLPL